MPLSVLRPKIALEDRRELFTVVVPARDPDLVALLVDGLCAVDLQAARHAVREALATLRGQKRVLLVEISLRMAKPGARLRGERLHCWGALRLPDGQLAITLGPKPAEEYSWRTPELQKQAVVADHQHRTALAAAAARAALGEIGDECFARHADLKSPDPFPPDSLLEQLPQGLIVFSKNGDPEANRSAALRAIQASLLAECPPPRGGDYRCVLTDAGDRGHVIALVTWTPHRGRPPYPEVRAATERWVPKAFSATRLSGARPPDEGGLFVADVDREAHPHPAAFDPHDPSWLKLVDRADFSFPGAPSMAGALRVALKQEGFEAIAWYQPHHLFTEDSWGIYVDAGRLDELTCTLSEDLRREAVRGPDQLAAKLAVGLVLEHQHFHARVEAAFTWTELQAGQPVYLRHQREMHAGASGLGPWLEEALASYWAWSWFGSEVMQAELDGRLSAPEREAVVGVVEAILDLAPPGHSKWREGRSQETWQALEAQTALARSRRPAAGVPFPASQQLRDQLPFDYCVADVPLRIVGSGQVAKRLFTPKGR